MKFGDKLIQLRKKNGLSQEELAEKLGVSRQSVSKWESNNTYPETDKIVQICNLFDCSMDDLINDKVVDLDQTLRKNKNNFNEAMDSFLEFVTKTVEMFSSMTFLSGLKCIFELFLIGLALFLSGKLICFLAAHIVANLFQFLNYQTVKQIENILMNILYLIWFIGSIIVMIHTFKIRYLNYFIKEKKEIKEDEKGEREEKNEKKEKNEPRIVIRDEKDKPFAFLKILSKIMIFCVKVVVSFMLLGITIATICIVITGAISAALIPYNMIFLGSTLAIIGCLLFMTILLIIGIYFIIHKNVKWTAILIMFFSAILTLGIGAGIGFISLKDLTFIEESKLATEEKSLTVNYEDNMVIESGTGLSSIYYYHIDNTIPENQIKITKETYPKNELYYYNHHMDQMNDIVIYTRFNGEYKEIIEDILKDLKEKKIYMDYGNYDTDYPITITANEKTINQLIENAKKLYLIEVVEENGEKTVYFRDYKVYFPYGVEGYYDARKDELHIEEYDDDYSCIRSITETEWGDKIIFSCKYQIEEDDE